MASHHVITKPALTKVNHQVVKHQAKPLSAYKYVYTYTLYIHTYKCLTNKETIQRILKHTWLKDAPTAPTTMEPFQRRSIFVYIKPDFPASGSVSLEGCFWLFALYLFHKIPQQKTGNFIHSSGIDVHPGLNASASLFDHLDPMFIQFSCNKKQLKIHNSYRKNNQAKLPWLFLWTLSIIIHLNFSTKKHLGVYVLQKIPVASCKFRFVGKSCTFKWPPSHGTGTKKVRVFQTSTLLNSKGL